MMRIVVATNNAGKLREYERLLADVSGLSFESMASVGLDIDVVEDKNTFYGNALTKAREVAKAVSLPAMADDSGLEVDALDGRPGVYSARYAGEGATAALNNEKLLRELAGVADSDRAARFRCTIVVVNAAGSELVGAEGVCEGRIISQPRGSNGFGYDPVFVPEGFEKTMAELTPDAKNEISHRAKASARLAIALGELQTL